MKNYIDTVFIKMLIAFGACAFNDTTYGTSVEDLNDQLLELNERAETIQAKADGEKRELTEDEETELEGIFVDFKKIEANIQRRERIASQTTKLTTRAGRQTTQNGPDDDHGDGAQNSGARPIPSKSKVFREPSSAMKGKWGWNDFGEFAVGVRAAAMPNSAGQIDPRLIQNAPTTYSSEGVGADGGFLVPPDFRTTIMETVMAESSLFGRTDQMQSGSNSVTLPRDDTTNWQSSGGIQAYWEGEASQFTQSKLAINSDNVRLNKLTALVPVTEELLDDAAAVDSYLRKKVPEKFDFKINDAIIYGTGAGMPRGLMNSDALVTVSAESGQTADTIVAENIVNMYSRMVASSRPSSVWLINQDIEPQLFTMQMPTSATAVPVYMPPGGLSASPYATLMGRPVIAMQSMKTLGDLGDIALVDLNQYLTITKVAGIRTDVSMHLWFDYDTMAYRFIWRVAGQPWRNSAISPLNGSNTVSSFVTLAARA